MVGGRSRQARENQLAAIVLECKCARKGLILVWPAHRVHILYSARQDADSIGTEVTGDDNGARGIESTELESVISAQLVCDRDAELSGSAGDRHRCRFAVGNLDRPSPASWAAIGRAGKAAVGGQSP